MTATFTDRANRESNQSPVRTTKPRPKPWEGGGGGANVDTFGLSERVTVRLAGQGEDFKGYRRPRLKDVRERGGAISPGQVNEDGPTRPAAKSRTSIDAKPLGSGPRLAYWPCTTRT